MAHEGGVITIIAEVATNRVAQVFSNSCMQDPTVNFIIYSQKNYLRQNVENLLDRKCHLCPSRLSKLGAIFPELLLNKFLQVLCITQTVYLSVKERDCALCLATMKYFPIEDDACAIK